MSDAGPLYPLIALREVPFLANYAATAKNNRVGVPSQFCFERGLVLVVKRVDGAGFRTLWRVGTVKGGLYRAEQIRLWKIVESCGSFPFLTSPEESGRRGRRKGMEADLDRLRLIHG